MEVLPLLVEHYGEPYADSSAIPTYYVARETRKHVTVALNGDGGDESFAGYERYAAMQLAEKYHRIPAMLRDSLVQRAIGLIPSSETKRSRVRDVKRFLQAASLPKVERYLRWVSVFDTTAKQNLYSANFLHETQSIRAADILTPWFAQANGAGIVDAALLADINTYLPNDLLVKVDIATMAVSLEARSPFLDHHLIEFAASLPENLKLRGLTTKYLLKRMLKKLLPAENLDRKKMGFGVPIGHWFRGKLQPFLRETVLSEKALRRGLFRPEAVKQLVELHTRGERDNSHQLWTLLMLELWFQRFID
jgi:asparagine synthase (glutamine-hydrolysing)